MWNKKAERTGLVMLLLMSLITGCAGLPAIYTMAGGTGTYVVRKGDSLYSIAFRYGLDYKSLARINGVRPPYTIYVNQSLRLRGSAKLPQKDAGPNVTPPSSKSPTKSLSKRAGAPVVPKALVASWRWPLKGRVLNGFSLVQPLNKGIDIAGDAGDTVIAAADGVVVYAGGNLKGYGQLVIVKHNDHFLSAYGNNEKILVREGEKVIAGKAIGRVGKSVADIEMLHFEIRRDGKPVDPLKYLPAR